MLVLSFLAVLPKVIQIDMSYYCCTNWAGATVFFFFKPLFRPIFLALKMYRCGTVAANDTLSIKFSNRTEYKCHSDKIDTLYNILSTFIQKEVSSVGLNLK